jgi:hypothetical protein
MLTKETLMLKMEPWRVYRPVVADLHHCRSRIRIRMKVKS